MRLMNKTQQTFSTEDKDRDLKSQKIHYTIFLFKGYKGGLTNSSIVSARYEVVSGQ